MRTTLWMAALTVGLLVTGPAEAQTPATNRSTTPTRSTTQAARTGITRVFDRPFSFTSIFSRSNVNLSTRGMIGSSNVPDPSSAAYWKPFGFKRLY